MPVLRKIFFYIFVGLYCIICPLIILRMLGFVVMPGSHQFVKTGLIYISTNPPGASVLIDHVHAPEPTPTVIRDLMPGQHTVHIHLEGYRPLEKDVHVEGKKATALDNVLLVPIIWAPQELSPNPFDRIFAIIDNHYLLISDGDSLKDLSILDLNKNIDLAQSPQGAAIELPQNLFPEEFIYKDAQVLRYFTVDKSPFFVLHLLVGDKHKYLWVDPREKQAHIEDITDLLPQEPQDLFWESLDDRNVFVIEGASINRINIKAKAIYPKILDHVRSAAVFNNTLYALSEDLSLIRCDFEGTNLKGLNIPLPTSIRSSNNFKLSALKDKILLLNTDQGIVLIDTTARLVSGQGIMGYSLDEDRLDALVWNTHTIGVVNYSRPSLEEPFQPPMQVLFNKGRNIQQAFWINNGNAIIFRDGNTVYLLDAPDPHARLVKVITVQRDAPVHYLEKTGRLYYIDANTHVLSYIQVLYHKPLISIPIADPLRIKKRP